MSGFVRCDDLVTVVRAWVGVGLFADRATSDFDLPELLAEEHLAEWGQSLEEAVGQGPPRSDACVVLHDPLRSIWLGQDLERVEELRETVGRLADMLAPAKRPADVNVESSATESLVRITDPQVEMCLPLRGGAVERIELLRAINDALGRAPRRLAWFRVGDRSGLDQFVAVALTPEEEDRIVGLRGITFER